MANLNSIEDIISELKAFNADDHKHFAPTDLVEYARQAGVAVLLTNWEVALRNGGTTLNGLFRDLDDVVDRIDSMKSAIKTDIDYLRELNSDDNETFAPDQLSAYARQAVMEVLIHNWSEAAKTDPLDLRTMIADIDYTRADLLKLRAVLQAEYRDVLDDEIEEQPRPRM